MPEVGLFVVLNEIVRLWPFGGGCDVTTPLGNGLTIAFSGAVITWPVPDSGYVPFTSESKMTVQFTPSVDISCCTPEYTAAYP